MRVLRLTMQVCAERFAAPAAIAAVLFAGVASAEWTLQPVGVCTRDEGAAGMSGVTWTGGDGYLAVCDRRATLHPMTVKLVDDGLDCSLGKPVVLQGCGDVEGCALDPLAKTLWASDEKGATVCEFDIATGARLRSAPVPERMRRYRSNYSLEALTISPDGLSMWTANEEALSCDGELSSATSGTAVRLVKFVRRGASDGWRAAGQWAYRTERLSEAANPMKTNRCGLSALCALPDGTLLALERELSGYTFRFRIYELSFAGATDVSQVESLADADFKPVGKRLLHSYAKRYSMMRPNDGLGNYEGMCLGGPLPGGGRALVLVADSGDRITMPLVMMMRLDRKQAD